MGPEELRKLREKAADLQEEMLSHLPPAQRVCPPKRDLVEMGKALWTQSYRHSQDDGEAFGHLFWWFREMAKLKPEIVPLASAFIFLPQEQILQWWSARWADQGFPTFQLGHKYAAALMATMVRPQDVQDIRPPFKAFLIEVPKGLLSVCHTEQDKQYPIIKVAVHYNLRPDGEASWNYSALTEGPVTTWKHGLPTKVLAGEEFEGAMEDWESYSFAFELGDQDERVNALISRLIVGVCLTASSPDESKPVGKGHQKSAGQLRESPEPEVRTYVLGKPIKLDVRQAIKDYVAGGIRKSPSVQTLVRGHWKRQPHGPRSSLRKWIWREPFWRGLENAPILCRPHQIGE